jgi:hypothetical protein
MGGYIHPTSQNGPKNQANQMFFEIEIQNVEIEISKRVVIMVFEIEISFQLYANVMQTFPFGRNFLCKYIITEKTMRYVLNGYLWTDHCLLPTSILELEVL